MMDLLEDCLKRVQALWEPRLLSCRDCMCSVCTRDVNKAPHYTATFLMAKIMEMMGFLLMDTMAKACRKLI